MLGFPCIRHPIPVHISPSSFALKFRPAPYVGWSGIHAVDSKLRGTRSDFPDNSAVDGIPGW